jgi:hypothetical protein
MDLVVVVAANLFNLLMAAVFLTRTRGWKQFKQVVGLFFILSSFLFCLAAETSQRLSQILGGEPRKGFSS